MLESRQQVEDNDKFWKGVISKREENGRKDRENMIVQQLTHVTNDNIQLLFLESWKPMKEVLLNIVSKFTIYGQDSIQRLKREEQHAQVVQ